MIMHGKTLLLTALGVMFCSGCTTEQQTPAPPDESGKETSVQQTPDPNTQGGSVQSQLEELGARIKGNEQGEVEVSLRDTKITDAGLVHLKGLTNLKTL